MARRIAATALIGLLLAAAIGAGSGSAADGKADSERSLKQRMKRIEKGFERVRKRIRDPERNPGTLAIVARMQRHALAAKRLAPPPAPGRDAASAERRRRFRERMIDLLKALLELERDLLRDENRAGFAHVKAIQKLKMKAHDRFQVD